MSSTVFGVVLRTEQTGRKIVCLSGIGLMLTGMVLILSLPFSTSWRIVLLLIWLTDCSLTFSRLAIAWRQVTAIRLDIAGSVHTEAPDGSLVQTTLESGSVVCRRVAWLRFRLADGRPHGELLLASGTEALTWHRFQLIWRLCRATFGHPGRA